MALPLRITADTLVGFIHQDFPRIHADLVPRDAKGAFSIKVELRGNTTFKLHVDGPKVTVTQENDLKPDAWVSLDGAGAEQFFQAFVKSGKPLSTPPVLLTDPRLLKNLSMASATLALSLRDFRLAPDAVPARFTVRAAVGPAAAKKTAADTPDVEIEAGERTLLALTSAQMTPDDALADGDVQLSGKKFVAMQLALAFAPFFKKA